MLGSAAEEMKKSDEMWGQSNFTALREQQEQDFGLWGPHTFEMDKKEGKWRDVTSTSARVIANKIMALLAASWRQLYIDLGEDENKKQRKVITRTEQFANGCIDLADRDLTSVPSGKSIQDSLSFFATIKGGTAKSVYFTEDEKGEVTPDILVYDPEFCQWIEGDRKLLWFCYRDYVTKAFIERTYKKQVEKGLSYKTPDVNGLVQRYTFWNEESWRVAMVGSEDYIDGDDHNLGYVPVNIRSCGIAPALQSVNYQDVLKFQFQSVFANDRDIYDIDSELLSIGLSKAVESGKIKLAGEFDSSKGDAPAELAKLGYGSQSGRNAIVMFDTAKGQKFGGMIQPPDNQMVERFQALLEQRKIISSIDPIAFGQMTRSGSGTLAAELRAAALEFIIPFRKCVEDDSVWIAEECVRQFKGGNFGKMSIQGRDAKKNKFFTDISPKDVAEKRFDCHLVPDRLRDEIQELGAAIQSVQSGLTSKRTARVRHNIVEDPDREQDIMDEELAAQDPVFQYDKLAKYFKDQGTPEGDKYAQYFLALEALTIDKTINEARAKALLPSASLRTSPPAPSQVPLPPDINPLAQAGKIAAEPRQVVPLVPIRLQPESSARGRQSEEVENV